MYLFKSFLFLNARKNTLLDFIKNLLKIFNTLKKIFSANLRNSIKIAGPIL